MSKTSQTSIQQLIQLIYSAVNRPDAWELIARQLDTLITSPQGMFLLRSKPDMRPVDAFLWGNLRASFQQYVDYYYQVDIWSNTLLEKEPGRFRATHELVPDKVFLRSELHGDFARPINVRHGTGVVFDIPGQELVAEFACMRENGQAHFDEKALAVLDILVPHFQQFISLRQRFNEITLLACSMEPLIDAMGAAAVICQRNRQVLYQNALAEQFYVDGEVLNNKNGHLYLSNTADDIVLRDLVSCACDTVAGKVTRPGGIFRPSRTGLEIQVYPLPYAPFISLFDTPQPCCLIVISEVRQFVIPTPQQLQERYDLTQAEAEVAVLLVSAYSAEDVAERRGVTLATIRVQARSIYAKLEVNSQVELMRKLIC